MRERLEAIEERIVKACARAARPREAVTLIAVSKIFPAAALEEAYALGMREFGESYVQEFEVKKPQLQGMPDARFHLIGHLQSNKSRKAAELFQTIQTVDSAKLARRLNDHGFPLDVMIEVKLSDEEAKHGADPAELPAIIHAVRQCPQLTLRGLMTIPPWSEDAETARPYFVRLRELAEEFKLPALSMGMSNDFEVAIEEGATHIRVGTALFGSRRKP
ncbi:MAG: YggS family pyridoxal phosphate-dependent enzyme [Acidobacteria bacterium]|nr:YggS family pyridoxal phosphate-dependent enzyme [Acidobacteriota bacterium]